MTSSIVKNDQRANYYGPLVSQHVKLILQSALLLDEDYEVLLKVADFKIYPIKRGEAPLGLIGGILTVAGSIFLTNRYDTKLAFVPTAVVGCALAWTKWRCARKRKLQREVISRLLRHMVKLQKFHSSVIQYMRTRNELKRKTDEELLLIYEKNVEEYIKTSIKKNGDFFVDILEYLNYFVTIDDELSQDYDTIKVLNIQSLLQMKNGDHQTTVKTIYDLYIFLSSKFLNYLGISLTQHLLNNNTREIDNILDRRLPQFIKNIANLHDDLRNHFNDLRYTASKKMEIETKSRSQMRRHIEGKLHYTLTETVNNLSIIMERSRAILERVETEENPSKINVILSDLRAHSLATYESLDILCKLYGILADSDREAKPPETRPVLQETVEPKIHNAVEEDDDELKPFEINYELFIPEGEEVREERTEDDDQAGRYLGLMIRELRQSLKQHERFKTARELRGIKDDDDGEQRVVREDSPPKFDMNAFKETKEVAPPAPPPPPVLPNGLEKPPEPAVIPLAPPPPPSFNLYHLLADDDDNDVGNNRTFFDNIRVLSSQVHRNEEVFGDDDSDQNQ